LIARAAVANDALAAGDAADDAAGDGSSVDAVGDAAAPHLSAAAGLEADAGEAAMGLRARARGDIAPRSAPARRVRGRTVT